MDVLTQLSALGQAVTGCLKIEYEKEETVFGP